MEVVGINKTLLLKTLGILADYDFDLAIDKDTESLYILFTQGTLLDNSVSAQLQGIGWEFDGHHWYHLF